YLELSSLAFFVLRVHAYFEAVHATVVVLLFRQRKAQTVTRSQVADDAREASTVVFHTSHLNCLATRLLRQKLGAAVQTQPHPTRNRFADRHQKLEQRAQLHRQRVEDHVIANQDLLRRVTILEKYRRDTIRHPDDRGLRVGPQLRSLTRSVFHCRSHVVD